VLGAGGGGTLALALLVCACVFAALAGPALSLHTRTEALQQTLSGLTGTTKSLQASAAYNDFTGSIGFATGDGAVALNSQAIGAGTTEIARGFAREGVPIGPGSWGAQTTKTNLVFGAAPSAQAGGDPKIEVTYR